MARSVERRRDGSRERERELVLAFQGGDPLAYDSIDRSCRPAAERICKRLLVNPADVEEAVQETMVRAYQGLPRFNGSYALTAWVARIATNVCLDTLRARSRRPQAVAPIQPDLEPRNGEGGNGNLDPVEIVEQIDEAEEVRKVLADLPERHRTALVLREFEGYSHRKIAAMLDTSPERVKALIHRAKAGFRRVWTDDGHPGRLAAFAPLLTPINWLRRLFGRAPEFDYSSTASAANVAASPATQTFTAVASERISTAVAAVMLAGTVSFAVQHAPNPSRAQEAPAVVELVEAPEETPDEVRPRPNAGRERERPEPEREAIPSPEPSPTPEIAGDLAEEPKDEQDISAVAEESDLPPHPPGFTFSFTTDRTSANPCRCGSPVLRQDVLAVSKDQFSSFSGSILNAPLADSTGTLAWLIEDLHVSASLERIDLSFELRSNDGSSIYNADGFQAVVNAEAWGGWTIGFEGSFERRGGPVEHSDVPMKGSLSGSLTVSWEQQRLVAAILRFTESV